MNNLCTARKCQVAALVQQMESESVADTSGITGGKQEIAKHAWIREKQARMAATQELLAAPVGSVQTKELVLTGILALDYEEEHHMMVRTRSTERQIWEQEERQMEAQPARRSSLHLGSRVIHEGDQLALWIFGDWIVGEARQDRTDWYLLTATKVRIRLSVGLTARWGEPTEGAHA